MDGWGFRIGEGLTRHRPLQLAPVGAVFQHGFAKRRQFQRGHVVLGVIGAPSADNEVRFRPVGMVIDGREHGVLLLVLPLAGGRLVAVVGPDQLPVEPLTGPVVTSFRYHHRLMNRKSVLLNIAGAATLLVPFAQGDGLALHPAWIDGFRSGGNPVGSGCVHRCQ